MAKKSYIGISGKARRIKKAYIGINGIARKVKKIYIGIGNIARCIFTGGELKYYGTTTPLSVARYLLAATTVGNYALFGGGYGDSKYHDTVDTYSSSLVKGTTTPLSVARSEHSATTVGNYALFAGGYSYNSSSSESIFANTVDTYSSSLVKGTATVLSSGRYYLAATTVGNYALFGGGSGLENGTSASTINAASRLSTVDAYSESLMKIYVSNLSDNATILAATTVGNYALFGGGYTGDSTNALATVNSYNTSLTRSTPTPLSVARSYLAATTVGNYALFGGGYTGRGYTSVVDAYNTSLTRLTPAGFSEARDEHSATTVGNYAIFSYSYTSKGVDVYDSNLVKISLPDTASPIRCSKATTVGNYALFGGGLNSISYNTVNAYVVD